MTFNDLVPGDVYQNSWGERKIFLLVARERRRFTWLNLESGEAEEVVFHPSDPNILTTIPPAQLLHLAPRNEGK